MINKYRIGELRPSQIMFSYGIGAIADLPNLAAMVMGLEDWQRQHTQVITEDRLLAAVQEQLGAQVLQLVSLPIPEEEARPSYLSYQPNLEGIPVAPFPTWMVCPRCDLLAPITPGMFDLKIPYNRHSEAAYYHVNCPNVSNTSTKFPKVIPVRFLAACEKGHLDDFPWRYFVHRGNGDCKGTLRLIEPSVSGAVTDIVVKCDGCNTSRRMSDTFGLSGKQNMPRCRGRHPHLRSFDEKCDRQMKTMLLGASNSWFSLSLSALSIPNAENKLEQYIDSYWLTLGETDSAETLKILLKILQKQGKGYELENYKIEEIWEAIAKRQQGISQDQSEYAPNDLKTPEWRKFQSVTGIEDQGKDWRLKAIAPPVDFDKVISKVILVEKLREVRSLIGFTRIQSSGDFTDTGDVPKEYRAPLSRSSPTWVPAMEVRGEGIFIEFNEQALQAWEQKSAVRKQHIKVKEAHKNWLNQRNPELVDKISTPDMRYLLIHSFSHALMRQLAIECGYNAASLRERIYAQVEKSDRQAQAGLLIYTAAPDSEGTLGGLVHLGEAPRLNHHIRQALESIRICTSDPLCAEHNPADDKVSLHWAACHACLFSPETSCERGNKFLDRALLVPTFSETDICFFN